MTAKALHTMAASPAYLEGHLTSQSTSATVRRWLIRGCSCFDWFATRSNIDIAQFPNLSAHQVMMMTIVMPCAPPATANARMAHLGPR
jgi:glutathione S-transferase